ncbi:MAG: hypothetical protein U0821_05915 [Chloroflexota bacterium]
MQDWSLVAAFGAIGSLAHVFIWFRPDAARRNQRNTHLLANLFSGIVTHLLLGASASILIWYLYSDPAPMSSKRDTADWLASLIVGLGAAGTFSGWIQLRGN